MASPNRVLIRAWTDGSCSVKGNHPGGFGVYVRVGQREVFLRRGFWNTTTSRMEMSALLEAVRMVDPDELTELQVYSDSQFVVNAFKKGWLKTWRMNGWNGVKNVEMWKGVLFEIERRRKMRFGITWLRGHGKDLEDDLVYGNAIADELANYKTQDKLVQDLDLEGFSWFHHASSDCVFIEKTNRYEEINKMGDIVPLGKCKRATFEELFDVVNGTFLFENLYNGSLDVSYEVKEL